MSNTTQKTNTTTTNINTNTIMIAILLLFTVFNGCQNCSNAKSTKKIERRTAEIAVQQKNSDSLLILYQNKTIDKFIQAIEDNSEAGVIIEKEIDRKVMSPSEVKALFKLYRTYAK